MDCRDRLRLCLRLSPHSPKPTRVDGFEFLLSSKRSTMEEEPVEVETQKDKTVKPKRVSRRKLVKRPKQRGKYKSQKVPVGSCDPDVLECMFSDDEVRAEYIESNISDVAALEGQIIEQSASESDQSAGNESSTSGLVSPAPSSEGAPDSASTSRPSSAFSFTSDTTLPEDSDSSSRSSSVMSTRSAPTRQSLSAAADILLTLGASTPLPRATVDDETVQSPSCDIIAAGIKVIKESLPAAWAVIADKHSFHLLLLSSAPKSVQREIVIFYNGRVSINVHCESILNDKVLSLNPIPRLTCSDSDLLMKLKESALKLVNLVMDFDICVGANHEKTRSVWSSIQDAYIDLNPYREESYQETCRSYQCQRLVRTDHGKVARCVSCVTVMKNLRKRESFLSCETPHVHTPNMYLTLPQALHKLTDLSDTIRKQEKRIDYLEGKVKHLIEKEGVDLDEDLSKDLNSILDKCELTDIQRLFLSQQLQAVGKKNPRCRRWHPTMIRWALHMRMKSRSTYESMRDSGALILPSSRTLFDYSHAIDTQEGVSDGILSIVEDRVRKMKKEYTKYHSLICDEMYVSQNLVHKKKDNSLCGYAKLDEVDKEMEKLKLHLENRFWGVEHFEEPQMAKTMLAFMVKGIATSIKYVVGAYPTKDVTADMLYSRAWEVIGRLERANIKVLAFICDGHPTNRTFVGMHTPLTKKKPGFVFDTLNFCSPEARPLYFVFDVCHLLKTIRNCFYNSGDSEKKPRCMELNGQKIQWKTIVRLYLTFRDHNFRKSYKLNAQNVFPNAFSCMKVRYAAQVLSNTVANDIEYQKWPETSETVKFIRYHNKFFDCLNSAYKDQGIRTKNNNLKPFTDGNDVRFSWLGVPNEGYEKAHGDETPYLQYLEEWKKQVNAKPVPLQKKEKMMLSWQSQGVETTIHSYAGVIRFMFKLQEPPKFILGRCLSQDPLEQKFGLHRMGGGGSRNPNTDQFLGKQVSLAIQQDIGVRTRGNVESSSQGMKITEEPLPKRARISKRK